MLNRQKNSNKYLIRRAFFLIVFSGLSIFPSKNALANLDNFLRSSNTRVFHFVPGNISLSDAEKILYLAAKERFNVIIITISSTVNFQTFPGNRHENPWSTEEYLTLIRKANSYGIEVIPEITLLTHQEKFFGQQHPELLFNGLTYNPLKTETYDLVFTYLDEVINLTHPKAIHIGHDEVIGWNKWHLEHTLGKDAKPLPADLFLKDVKILHDHLSKKGIQTWMWGDMLLSPDEFPSGADKNVHGNIPGYGKALRQQLPKDIVICDWHYGRTTWKENLLSSAQTEFPSIGLFRRDGFTVLGATWKDPEAIRNFSRDAARQGAAGMIATTWFHVQRKEWDIIDKIIRESGDAFIKDFSDSTSPRSTQ